MERIKKTILQAVTTGTTVSGTTIIIPDLSVVYYFKIGLKQVARDIGFFDAYVPVIEPEPPEPPEPPAETYNFIQYNGDVYIGESPVVNYTWQ